MDEKKPPLLSKKPKVLIAEDNPVVNKGLTEFLTKWGYTPMQVDNGDDALHMLEEDHQIRLAIVDWNMPGLSGMQVCQRLRIRPEGPYVYIIIFSARKSKEEEILALDGGADDYLVKPCKPSVLRARLGVGRRITETALPSQMNQNTIAAQAATDERKSEKDDSGDPEGENK